MAPSSADPQNLRVVLNPARRRALTTLLKSITAYMRTQITQNFDIPESSVPLAVTSSSPPSHSGDASPMTVDEEEVEQQRRLDRRLERDLSTPKLKDARAAALKYFDEWEREVFRAYGDVMNAPEDTRAAQRRRDERASRPPAYSKGSEPGERENIEAQIAEAKEVSALQDLYHPIPTRLSTISKEDLRIVISSMLLLLLSVGHYSAHSRVMLLHVSSSFCLPMAILTIEETEIAKSLLQASKTLTADAETQKRQQENQGSRWMKVGLASIAGAAVIGITGGLAAPVVAGAIGGLMGGVGLGGLASFLGTFAMNGALMGSLFGAFGARMTGEMMDNYAKEVEDFKFIKVKEEWGVATKDDDVAEGRRLRVTVGINGWLDTKDDVVKPWRSLGEDSEVFALRFEMEALLELGASLKSMVSSYAWSYVKLEILKRTVLATLWSALWPVYLLKMATSIDNPFAVARNRSEKAGEVLADALINKAQGERPVTLIGYSLGARVIYSCLNSLAERRAFGLVENVIFIGSPVPSNSNTWRVMRSVVSGKMINVYSENDYILAFLYRATSIQLGVAGLQKIQRVESVDNMDLSKEVSGHLRYPDLIGQILKRTSIVDVKDQSTTIESDGGEIQLIDMEDGEGGWGADSDSRGLDGSKIPMLQMMKEDTRAQVGHPSQQGRESEVTEVTRSLSQVKVASMDIDSEDEGGGIVMLDNDDNVADFDPGAFEDHAKYRFLDSDDKLVFR
jgi:hypothetical protein